MSENSVREFQNDMLDVIEESKGFIHWMFEQYEPYIQDGTIWEVGSGHGSMSQFLLKAKKLVLSEWDPNFRKILKHRYGSYKNVEITELDLEDLDVARFSGFKFDTIISTNVLEHIKNHEEAFRRITTLMQDSTVMITLVPAHPWLYGAIDKRVNHYRRYSKKHLRETLENAGQKVERMFYFNRASVPFWWFQSVLLGQDAIRSSDMKRIDTVLPILKLEKYFPLPFGQSVIAISRKA